MTSGSPQRQTWRFVVEPGEAGQRLDQIIPIRTGLSRRCVREILKVGGIQVNHRRVRVAGRVPVPGAEIRVALDESLGELPNFISEVLFEDEWIIALNKPQGIPTQGTQASDQHDFLAVVRRHFVGQELYLVHRLDTGTSGVLLMAKTSRTASDISEMFQGHEVKKTYVAAVSNPLEQSFIEKPIGRVPKSRPAQYACTGDLIDVKPAATKFYSLELPSGLAGLDMPSANWITAEPLTGRTHQIRVHLAHIGNPVIGDTFYGGQPSTRLWLHACKLELPHPITKETLMIQAVLNHEGMAV